MHHNHNMIRQETPEDYQNVELLTREAFLEWFIVLAV